MNARMIRPTMILMAIGAGCLLTGAEGGGCAASPETNGFVNFAGGVAQLGLASSGNADAANLVGIGVASYNATQNEYAQRRIAEAGRSQVNVNVVQPQQDANVVCARPVQRQTIISCPSCSEKNNVSQFNRGDRVCCPQCNTEFIVP